MDVEGLHARFEEFDKSEIIKEIDSVSFAEVKYEIDHIFKWEDNFYNSVEYRDQLPEGIRNTITNDLNTAANQFQEILTLRVQDVASLAQQKADRMNAIRELYGTIYRNFVQDYRGWLIDNEGNAIATKLEEVVRNAEKNLEQSVLDGKERTEQTSDEVLQKIVGAESTKEWALEYVKYIKRDLSIEKQITARVRKYELSIRASSGSWKDFWDISRSPSLRSIRCFWINRIQGAALYAGDSYVNLSNRWRFWRSLSYLFLLIIAIYYLLHTVVVGPPSRDQLVEFLLQKLTFIPLITVLALGLAFSSKNFKINLNLLEEYKHRYVVAKTIQNLLLLPENGPLRSDLLTKGTSILFEHRSSGYTDKDTELNLLEKMLSNPEISPYSIGKKIS